MSYVVDKLYLIDNWTDQTKHSLKSTTGMRESSFMFALSSAALANTIAKGCSSSSLLESCYCDLTSFSDEENAEAWKWGGCGDNYRFSQMFLKGFLKDSQGRGGADFQSILNRHNSDLGIRTVKKHFVKKCKCHGVSGTCEASTCWRQVKPFKVIGDELKLRYERSVRVSVENVANSRGVELVTKSSKRGGARSTTPSKGHMIYRNKSPDFCSRNQYSIGTAGRECNKTSTCESICCGRGYNIREITVKEKCRCTFQWCCDVHCAECTKNVELALCRE
ncbi:wingless-type [Apostichopus japonicus]|uniref:Protein Wnt n=1 Tax=Stichopus japonicus TaxID=307972 RepID=A0A2G8KTY4_STIJA|nr:wingless-type [Apostichopus japonicus]